MINIMIIGLGSIGSRHLESILKINKNKNIYLIDPKYNSNNQSLLLNSSNTKIFKFSEISNFNINFDLVIISTNSDVRFDITNKLFKLNKFKNLLLEKISFIKISHYNAINQKAIYYRTKIFVNYPRPMWKSYINLKKIIKNDVIIDMNFSSFSWNLCSNSLHYINLFNFLTNTDSINMVHHRILNRYFKSKRNSFYELKGSLVFCNDVKQKLYLQDTFKYSDQKLTINTKKYCINIFEKNGLMKIYNKDQKKITKNNFKTELQSDLTNIFFQSILDRDFSKLPTLASCTHSDTIFLNSLYKITKNKFDISNFKIT